MKPDKEADPLSFIPDSIDRQKHPICTLWWLFILLLSALAMSFAALVILVTQGKDGIINTPNQLSFSSSCPQYISKKYQVNNYTFKTKISTIALCIVCILGLIEIVILLIKGRKGLCYCEYESKQKYRKWLRPMQNVLNATRIVDTLPTTRQPLINKGQTPQNKTQIKKEPYEPNYPFSPLFFIFIFLHLLFLMVPFSTHFTQLIEWKKCNQFGIAQQKLSLILGMEGASLLLGLIVFVMTLRYKAYLEKGIIRQQVKIQPEPEKKPEKEPKPLIKKEQDEKKQVKQQQPVKQESQPSEVSLPELSPVVQQQQQPPEIKEQQKPPVKVQKKPQPKKKEMKKPVSKQKQIPPPKKQPAPQKQEPKPKQQKKPLKQKPKPVKVQEVVQKTHQFQKSDMNFNINVKVDMPQVQPNSHISQPRKSRKLRYEKYEEDESSSEDYTPRRPRRSYGKKRSQKLKKSQSRVIESDEDQEPTVIRRNVKEISTQTVVDQEIQTQLAIQNIPQKINQLPKSESIPSKLQVSQGINTLDIQDSVNKAIQTESIILGLEYQITPNDPTKTKSPIQIQMTEMDKKHTQTTKNTSQTSNITSSVPFQLSLTMTPSKTNLTMTPSFSNLMTASLQQNLSERKQIEVNHRDSIQEFDAVSVKGKPISPINKNNGLLLDNNYLFTSSEQQHHPVNSRLIAGKSFQKQPSKTKILELSSQVIEVHSNPSPRHTQINRIQPLHESQIIIQPSIQEKPQINSVPLIKLSPQLSVSSSKLQPELPRMGLRFKVSQNIIFRGIIHLYIKLNSARSGRKYKLDFRFGNQFSGVDLHN